MISRRARLAWATGAACAVLVILLLAGTRGGEGDPQRSDGASHAVARRGGAHVAPAADPGPSALAPLEDDGTNKPLVERMMDARGPKLVPRTTLTRERPNETRLWEEMAPEPPPTEVLDGEELGLEEEYQDPEWEWPDEEPVDEAWAEEEPLE